jgi:hypothetical protein
MNAIKERGHEMHTAVCTPAKRTPENGLFVILTPNAASDVM